jgi:MFS family permease
MALIPLIRDLSMLIVLMALFGLGHGFVFPAASTLVSRRADPEQHGLVTGLFYALLVFGVVVGAPLMAAVASVTNLGVGIWASAWIVLLGLLFLGRAYFASGSEASVPGVPGSPADPLNAPRRGESGPSDPLMTRR